MLLKYVCWAPPATEIVVKFALKYEEPYVYEPKEVCGQNFWVKQDGCIQVVNTHQVRIYKNWAEYLDLIDDAPNQQPTDPTPSVGSRERQWYEGSYLTSSNNQLSTNFGNNQDFR